MYLMGLVFTTLGNNIVHAFFLFLCFGFTIYFGSNESPGIFLPVTHNNYCLCTTGWKAFQITFSFDYQSLPVGCFVFFFFFGFHNSVLPLCTFGCPSLSCMIGLLFSPIVFGTCPLKPAFSLGTSALSFGNKTVQIPNCYPVVSVHRHL